MFNDRDIAVIGAGGVLAVFCLLLPVSFTWKAVIGVSEFGFAVIIAFLRIGVDRLPLEEWLRRRIRFRLRPKHWTYYERNPPDRSTPGRSSTSKKRRSRPRKTVRKELTGSPVISFSSSALTPDKLAVLLLGLVGVFVLFGLWDGGLVDIAGQFREVLP